jgi:hypothetical protein
MMSVRGIVAIVYCAVALGGCATPGVRQLSATQGAVVQPVSVTSTTTDKFYFMRADIFLEAGPDDHSRQQQMMTRPGFGPYQVNQTPLQLVVGLMYYFYPRCADTVSWNDAVSPVIDRSVNQVKVDCRNAGR